MEFNYRCTLSVACVLILTAPSAWAAPVARANADALAHGTVRAQLSAHQVRIERGSEVFSDAEQAKPGDIIEYRAVYTNDGGAAIRDVHGTMAVPEGTAYLSGSARPPRFETRLSGEAGYRIAPPTREIVDANGAARTVAIPAANYRELRWALGELRPGQAKTVSARVRVGTATTASTTATIATTATAATTATTAPDATPD